MPFWLQLPFFDLPHVTPDANGTARLDLPIPDVIRGTLWLQAVAIQSSMVVLGETAELRVN